jgi:large subunit ribosomal protein L22
MEATAQLRNNPRTNNNAGSSRKARLVADQVRGLAVDQALAILRHSPKAVSRRVEQTLLCAINNWRQKYDLDPADHDLFVKGIQVDASKTMKRFQPAPHGRAHRIRKRTHHLTITVASASPVQVEPVGGKSAQGAEA